MTNFWERKRKSWPGLFSTWPLVGKSSERQPSPRLKVARHWLSQAREAGCYPHPVPKTELVEEENKACSGGYSRIVFCDDSANGK
jgi:hypothetical protein